MLNSRSIGGKIAESRKRLRLSQAELAQQIAISPQAVGKWERGESLPDISTLSRLAEIFGVDLNYFSEGFKLEESGKSADTLESQSRELPKEELPKKSDRSWDMSQGNWANADFSGLKNLKERFSSSNIKNCQFLNADLSKLLIAKNNIELCDFSNASFSESKIQYSNLWASQFAHCSFVESAFLKNNIEKCNFAESDFTGAEIQECNIEHSVLEMARWKRTKFLKSNISHMVFTGTIEDCHFEHCSFYRVKFTDATLLNTFFKYNDGFKKVEFINCKVDKITYAFLKNNQANLTGLSMMD